MRILIVTQFYYPERFCTHDIARELVRRGHDVHVLTGLPNYGYGHILPAYKKCRYEEIDGVKIHRVKLIARKNSHFVVSLNYLSFWLNAKRAVKRLKIVADIVLSFSLSPVISIAPAVKYAKKHNVPHVLYCMDLWPESTVVTKAIRKNSLAYRILYKWSKSLYQNCDKILISSPSFKDYFEKELGLSKKHKYINQPPLSSNEKRPPIVYEKKYNFVYAGNIGKLQLIDLLVLAMEKLDSDDCALHLMGMGSELNDVLAKLNNPLLKEKVFYEGALPIEEAERYFYQSDALIVSLKNDGSYVSKTIPNKLTQYLKYGKPILGILGGDGKKLLEDAGGGIISSENVEEIAEKMKYIISLSEKEKQELGSKNRAYYKDNLSIEKLVNLFESELEDSLINK